MYKYPNEVASTSIINSSKSNTKIGSLMKLTQKEEIIDNAIKCMTESPEKDQENKYSDLTCLFKYPKNVVISIIKK